MHICFVDESFSLGEKPSGGSGIYIHNIIGELHDLGHRISIISFKSKKWTNIKIDKKITVYPLYWNTLIIWYLSRIPIISVLSKPLEYLLEGWFISKTIRLINKKHKIDIIEFTEGGDFWSCFQKNFPIVSHLHCSDYTALKQLHKPIPVTVQIKRMLEHIFIRRSSKVIAPSWKMISIVEKEMNHKINKKQMIPLPLDPGIRQVNMVKNKQHKLVTIFAARNDPIKGGEILLKAIKGMNEELSRKILFKFFGFISDSNLENVQFNDFVNRDILRMEMYSANIMVVPSYFDNSPNIIYEAMAMGMVVIASKVGGIPELIEDGKTGFLFRKGDYKTLGQIIARLADNNFLLDNVAKNAKKNIQKKSSLPRNARQRTNLYNSLSL